MKKFAFLAIVAMASTAFVACTNTSNEGDETQNADSVEVSAVEVVMEEAVEPATEAVEEAAQEVKTEAVKTVRKAATTTKKAAQEVKEAAQETANTVTEAAQETKQETVEAAQEVKEEAAQEVDLEKARLERIRKKHAAEVGQ